MSTQETLAVMAGIAASLEAEGAEILSAELPHWRTKEYTDYGYSEFSYVDGSLRVHWLVDWDELLSVEVTG